MIDDKHVHIKFMRSALTQARKAMRYEEVPVGAVIVKDGQIIGRGHNLCESRQDAVLHAEIMAIRQANRRLDSWRLEDCTLYVTLEPCLMCAGAIIRTRLNEVYYAAADPKSGVLDSVAHVFTLPLMHEVKHYGGLLADESSQLLKDFFRQKREHNKGVGGR